MGTAYRSPASRRRPISTTHLSSSGCSWLPLRLWPVSGLCSRTKATTPNATASYAAPLLPSPASTSAVNHADQGWESTAGRSSAAMPGCLRTDAWRCATIASASLSSPCCRPPVYSWLQAASPANSENRSHGCTRRWNSRPRGGGIGPLRGGGVKAGHLRSCPFRGPKRMAGGVSSGGLWGGSPVCAAGGAQPAGGGARVRAERGHGRQDVPVFGSPRLSAQQTTGEAEAGAADASDRRNPGVGPERTEEAAAHGQADFRAVAVRIRLCRRLHGGEGLRPAEAGADEGGLCAALSSAWPRPG